MPLLAKVEASASLVAKSPPKEHLVALKPGALTKISLSKVPRSRLPPMVPLAMPFIATMVASASLAAKSLPMEKIMALQPAALTKMSQSKMLGISITGGKVTANGKYYGIGASGSSKDVTISSAEVEATANGDSGYAIYSSNGGVSITGGKVTANGTYYGIGASGSDKDITIIGSEVTATATEETLLSRMPKSRLPPLIPLEPLVELSMPVVSASLAAKSPPLEQGMALEPAALAKMLLSAVPKSRLRAIMPFIAPMAASASLAAKSPPKEHFMALQPAALTKMSQSKKPKSRLPPLEPLKPQVMLSFPMVVSASLAAKSPPMEIIVALEPTTMAM